MRQKRLMDVRMSSVGRQHYIAADFCGTQYQEDWNVFDAGAYPLCQDD